MKRLFIVMLGVLFTSSAIAENWVFFQSSPNDLMKTSIDLDSIRPYKEGDAKNSKDNYRSAFIEFDLNFPLFMDMEVVRIMSLYVVNCDKNKLIILDSVSLDAEDNIVVPSKGTILSDSNMQTVFPKTKLADIYNVMCS